MGKTIEEEIKSTYSASYKCLTPCIESVGLAERLWANWAQSNISKPNIKQITKDIIQYQNSFFNEIVLMGCRMMNIPYNSIKIEQAIYLLDSYNLTSYKANDGYMVIIDDTFLTMLYNISNLLMFEVNNLIQEHEEPIFKSIFKQLVLEYIELKAFKPNLKKETSKIETLMCRSYDVTEYAAYLYHSLKIFLIAHEVGHCLFKHSEQHALRMDYNDVLNNSNYGHNVDYQNEYDADIFGYKLFMQIMNTHDNTIEATYLKYRYEYAPLLLFDLFDCIKEIVATRVNEKTHPSPKARKLNLLEHFQINEHDLLYQNLVHAIKYMVQ